MQNGFLEIKDFRIASNLCSGVVLHLWGGGYNPLLASILACSHICADTPNSEVLI